ncbi:MULTISPECIES: hypothetical protein [Halomonas]|uniref:hypothetical protein n=1 Tax=Halomonas TaxID=2745 RepID=UPI001868C2FA|nr:hypothetical protein [Halomonas colorata]
MKTWGKQAKFSELNVLSSDIAIGIECFSNVAYSLAKKNAETGCMFEMSAPNKQYDLMRGEQAHALAIQEDLPVEIGKLAGLVCIFESTNQPFELAKHYLGNNVFDFLQQACPANSNSTGML